MRAQATRVGFTSIVDAAQNLFVGQECPIKLASASAKAVFLSVLLKGIDDICRWQRPPSSRDTIN